MQQVLESGFVAYGDVCRAFEAQVCARVNAEAGVAVASGTIATALALESVGVGPFDTVITTGIGCRATINAIQRLGARVKFVDVEWSSQTMSPECLASALAQEDVAAILVIQFAGNTGQVRELATLAERHGVPMVVDACHHLGHVEYESVADSGDTGLVKVFSFSATKMITTGEGGMVVGPAATIADIRRRALGRGGVVPTATPGFKVVMSDIAASVGCSQLRDLDTTIARRQALARRYDRALACCSRLRPMPRDPGSNIHYYLAAAESPAATLDDLHDAGIQAIRLEGAAILKSLPGLELSVQILDHVVALPLYSAISEEQLAVVETALRKLRDYR